MSWYLYHNMTLELKEKLYTSSQVANILGVSLRTLYRYMESGKIKSLRTASGRHRFTKQQILQFLNSDPVETKPIDENLDNTSIYGRKNEDHFDFGAVQNDIDFSSFGKSLEQKKSLENRTDNDFDMSVGDEIDSTLTLNSDDLTFGGIADDINHSSMPSSMQNSNLEDIGTRMQPESNLPSSTLADVQTDFEVDSDFLGGFDNGSKNESKVEETSVVREIVESSKKSYSEIRYYQSTMTADTIELAKKINDLAKFKGIDYAFSCFAGLSLYFLLDKEFYTIHFYANIEEHDDWVKGLGLVETNKAEANIAIMVNSDIVFPAYKVVYDYRVIDDSVLMKDLRDLGEHDLVEQFKEYLQEQ